MMSLLLIVIKTFLKRVYHVIDIPDIDIDVLDRNHALSGLTFIKASMAQDGDLKRHPTGVFFQDIPVDPISGLSVFPSGKKSFDLADEMGFYKVDFIPNSAYQYVDSPDHLNKLLDKPIDWDLFLCENVVNKLQHINSHFEIIDAYEPKSVVDLACLIAIIRPAKRRLIGQPWETVREQIWQKEGDQYAFKKSHGIAFALMITVQLQSMIEKGIFDV